MKVQPQTWHYGIVAQHWAELQNHSVDGPEIAYYQKFIEQKRGATRTRCSVWHGSSADTLYYGCSGCRRL